MNGALVVIEGVDGSGKTTLAKSLVAEAAKRGRRVTHCYFPTHNQIGRIIRKAICGEEPVEPSVMLWLFAADAAFAAQSLRQHIEDGELVVCDRDVRLSGLVYQVDEHPEEVVRGVTPWSLLPTIDHLIVLDVDSAEAMRRVGSRGLTLHDMYEHNFEIKRDRYAGYAMAAAAVRPTCTTFICNASPEETLRISCRDLSLRGLL